MNITKPAFPYDWGWSKCFSTQDYGATKLKKLILFWSRTVRDVHVLEQCEIHPLRTEFVEDLGEGAFGKVHKATLKNGLDYLKNGDDFIGKAKREMIVAVKELHGEYEYDPLRCHHQHFILIIIYYCSATKNGRSVKNIMK